MSRILPVLALLAISLPAPAWQSAVNSGKPGPYLKITPVQLRYKVSWDGKLNSGDVTFLFGRPDKRYPRHFIAQAYGGSGGIAKTLYPYKFSFTSILNQSDYTPAVFIGDEVDAEERKDTSNRYGGSVRSTEVTTLAKKGAAPITRTSNFPYSKTTVYDFLSSILYIRSLPLKNGDSTTLVMHPFASPYLAKVTVLGREPHNGRNCIRLGLALNKIDPVTLKLRSYKKMKSATMWITDDAERLPLEVRSKVFIGDVRAVLTERKFL